MNFFQEATSESEEYTFVEVDGFKIRLVPEHSLWSHVLFNASVALGRMLAGYNLTYKRVLELGAGAGYPSLVAASAGASVTATDFPEAPILDNIAFNAYQNGLKIEVRGLLFGQHLDRKFDIVLLSDCIQLTQEHDNMINTLLDSTNQESVVYVAYYVHQPEKISKYLRFFESAARFFKTESSVLVKCQRQFAEDDAIYDYQARENCTIVSLRRRNEL